MDVDLMRFPALVAHADWSVSPRKRWMAIAILDGSGRYQVREPQRVDDPGTLLARLNSAVGLEESILVGFDFPIGLPLSYAEKCAIDDFLALLPGLGQGVWADFYLPAEKPDEIRLERPFYPLRPGKARQEHLLKALGFGSMDCLRRRCELAYPGRRSAAPLFWTLGGQQVGKAAISGWRDVLAPELRSSRLGLAIWPFSGSLVELLNNRRLVVAETYPGEFYHHLGVRFPFVRDGSRLKRGKRVQASRAANAGILLDWARQHDMGISVKLELAIRDGFGACKDGEDRFDAVIGLFGMLNILLRQRLPEEPSDRCLRKIEGWILGQAFVVD